MSGHAFYLEPDKWRTMPVLEGQEAAHARVLRLREGEKAALFDGRGRAANCVVAKIERKRIILEIEKEQFIAEPVSRPILALALSKAVRRGFFMEKAEELGAWEIWLWQADRSQGKLVPAVVESCRQQLVAGLKQSRNPWLCGVKDARNAKGVARFAENISHKIMPWEERAGTAPLGPAELGRPGVTVYVIGPEGGFSNDEAALFIANGFRPASLGNRVLRCETAATLCLALHWWASQLAQTKNA